MKMQNCLKPLAACLLISAPALPAFAGPAATPYQVLFNFSGNSGNMPTTGLLADKKGNLHGVTNIGGTNNAGTVFKLAPDGTETVLYSFTGGNDGATPDCTLTEDKSGNLYGTTFLGGAYGYGVVFKIAPDGTETVLHAFAGGAQDGAQPHGGVWIGKKGWLYGATQGGGPSGDGAVFVLKPSGKIKILHFFSGADGSTPEAGVILDKKGNIYGTTLEGGSGNVGTVYKVAADGTESVLYSFQNGFDGAEPASDLIQDKSGNLYGTALIGGANYSGVVFEVTPSGTENVLYTFTGGADGNLPYSTLLRDGHGNFYGTTAQGGNSNYGVVFKLAADGTETVLHSFTGESDGDTPYAGLITDPALGGNYLYGTTSGAACLGCRDLGTIYKIKE